MKAKVIEIYIDKDTDLLQEIGKVIEVTKERFEEINSTSLGIFLEEIKEVKEVKKKSTKK